MPRRAICLRDRETCGPGQLAVEGDRVGAASLEALPAEQVIREVAAARAKISERAAHEAAVLHPEEIRAEDPFQGGGNLAPIEAVRLAAERPGELAKSDGADEESIRHLLGTGDERFDPLGLDRIVGSE